jgi:hypothetical protein
VVKKGKHFSRIYSWRQQASAKKSETIGGERDEAENLKKGGELEHVDYDHLDKIIHDVSLALAVEIKRSLDLHAASTTEEK